MDNAPQTMTTSPAWPAWLGFALGLAALIAISSHLFLGPFAPQPTTGSGLVELGAEIKDALANQLRGDPPPPPVPVVRDADDWIRAGGILASIVGLAVSVLALVLRRSPKVAAVGAGLSALALFSLWFWWLVIVACAMLLIFTVGDVVGDVIGGIFPS